MKDNSLHKCLCSLFIMKEIIRNLSIIILFLIITPSVCAFSKVDPDVLSEVTSDYVYDQTSNEIKLDRNPEDPKYFCQKDVAKETVAVNVKHVTQCWNLCRNCSFFSWHTKDLTCHYGELVKQH